MGKKHASQYANFGSLLDGIYEEFYLITQLKREYELLFSFQLFLIGLKYEQMKKNIILQNILTL